MIGRIRRIAVAFIFASGIGLATLAVPAGASTVSAASAATCSATVGGTVTWGNAGNYNAYSTYDNCTTWRAWVVCGNLTQLFNRYGSWRSTKGLHSVAGCVNGTHVEGGGWETSYGQYFKQF